MPLTNFPNGVSSYGIPVLPAIRYPSIGSVFFVDAATGSDARDGVQPDVGASGSGPLATINAAVAKCTANKGDIIYCMPNHYEDLADTSTTGAIDLDVAGISLIGLGNGSNIPRIDFNDADSDFLVGAANVLIENMHFEATVTGVKIGVSVEAGAHYTTIRNCRFTVETATTDEFLDTISVAAATDYVTVEGCLIDMGLGGATSGIVFNGASHGSVIRANRIRGDYSTACIESAVALQTEMLIEFNTLENGYTTGIGEVACISMLTGTGGIIQHNFIMCNVATAVLAAIADTMIFHQNYVSEDISEAADSIVWGAAGSVTPHADG